MNELERYKQWNDAFYEHYFGEGRDNVILYIDNEIINKIGHQLDPNDEDPVKTFFYTVLMEGPRRRNFAKSINCNTEDRESCGFILFLDDIENCNIFFLAQELAEKGNTPRNKYLKLPCLCYLVFIIYAFQYGKDGKRAENPKWDYVSQVIGDYLDEDISTKDRSATVDKLFRAVSNSQPNFDSNLTTGVQPYVGRIKYQFVLTNAERKLLYNILDTHKLRWDEDRLSYAEFANRYVLPYLTGNQYASLRKKILVSDNNVYFRNIISQFDPQNYHSDDEDKKAHGLFLYIYSLEERCFYLGVDIKIDGELQFDNVYFTPDKEFYGLFKSDKQKFQSIETRCVETNDVVIHTVECDVLFFELKGYYYVQCTADDIIDGRSYLVVSNNERKINAILNGQNSRPSNLQGFNFNYMFFIPSWTQQERGRRTRIVKERLYSFGFGIKNPSKPNSYYPEGIPSIVVSNETIENVKSIKVICKQIGRQDICNTITKLRKSGRNELFYRLPDDLLGIRDPYKLEVYVVINYDGGQHETEELVGVINVQPCLLENYARSSFVYDKWNRTLPQIPETGAYYQNNKVYRATNNPHQSNCIILQEERVSKEPREDMMMLANILFVVFNQENEIDDVKLNNIIKYVGGYYNFDAGDYKVRNSLKHSLLNLGFMSRSFTTKYLYRPNNVRVVRTNRGLTAYSNLSLLYGTYSIHEIDKINNAECPIRYRCPYTLSELENRPFLICLPDIVLVDKYDENKVGINYVDNPLADDLINFIGNMRDFEGAFLHREGYREDGVDQQGLPRYTSIDGKIILETNRGRYDKYEFVNANGNPQYFRLPEALVKLYCNNKHNQSVCILKAPQRNGNEYPSIYFERFSMGAPRLLQKALCELDLRLPSLIYVFPIDRFIDGGKLYSQLYEYNDKDLKKSIVEKLSGHSSDNVYQDRSVSLVSSADYLKRYQMKLLSFQRNQGGNINKVLVLYYSMGKISEDKIIAFSQYTENNEIKVYGTRQDYKLENVTDYYEIIDNDVNHAFSSIILNRQIKYGNVLYDKIVPSCSADNLLSSIDVIVMAKQSNDN